jgi:hypothetical protein
VLGAAAEDSVFLDVDSLKPGDSWRDEILGAIKSSQVFILCWCCEAQTSTFIAEEIATALKDPRKRLVPVRLCPIPLPPPLAVRQWVDLCRQIWHECEHRWPDYKLETPIEYQITWDKPLGHFHGEHDDDADFIKDLRRKQLEREDKQRRRSRSATLVERLFTRVAVPPILKDIAMVGIVVLLGVLITLPWIDVPILESSGAFGGPSTLQVPWVTLAVAAAIAAWLIARILHRRHQAAVEATELADMAAAYFRVEARTTFRRRR